RSTSTSSVPPTRAPSHTVLLSAPVTWPTTSPVGPAIGHGRSARVTSPTPPCTRLVNPAGAVQVPPAQQVAAQISSRSGPVVAIATGGVTVSLARSVALATSTSQGSPEATTPCHSVA